VLSVAIAFHLIIVIIVPAFLIELSLHPIMSGLHPLVVL
jgi:hypothetical protein